MQRAICSHSNPTFNSLADQGCLLREGGTPDSFGPAASRNTRINISQEERQDALQRELDALEDDVLPQKYKESTYKPNPNVKHDSLPTMEMVGAGIEEMSEAELLCRVDEVISERLAGTMTAMIP